jgi:hypothetical protein
MKIGVCIADPSKPHFCPTKKTECPLLLSLLDDDDDRVNCDYFKFLVDSEKPNKER